MVVLDLTAQQSIGHKVHIKHHHHIAAAPVNGSIAHLVRAVVVVLGLLSRKRTNERRQRVGSSTHAHSHTSYIVDNHQMQIDQSLYVGRDSVQPIDLSNVVVLGNVDRGRDRAAPRRCHGLEAREPIESEMCGNRNVVLALRPSSECAATHRVSLLLARTWTAVAVR